MKRSDAIKKYGKRMWGKMCKTEEMDGISVRQLPDGDIDIPQYDIERALLATRQCRR
jgi:hypothetical protein